MTINNLLNLELVNCNICNNSGYKFVTKAKSLYTDDYFYVVKCDKCGLTFINPRIKITNKKLDLENIDGIEYFEKTRQRDNPIYESILKDIEGFTQRKGKLLDFGCATGGFLLKARAKDWDVYGVEINKKCAEFARNYHKLNVLNGELKEINFPSEYFDVVVMIHVIEHLYNPKDCLKEINRILKKSGLLYVITPNFDNYIIRFFKKFGGFENIDNLNPTAHPYMFTKYSLRNLLISGGFMVLDINDGINLMSVKKSLENNNSIFLKIFITQINNLVKILNKIGGGSSLTIIGKKC